MHIALTRACHAGKIHIKDIVSSSILREFNELRNREEGEHPQLDSEWFTARAAMRVYGTYLQLDVDHNGMLSREEFMRYNGGSLTSVFVDRLFQECRMYATEQNNIEMVTRARRVARLACPLTARHRTTRHSSTSG